jgi:hypothetical protein
MDRRGALLGIGLLLLAPAALPQAKDQKEAKVTLIVTGMT